jgi:type VI secretion system secreted protein VgrG
MSLYQQILAALTGTPTQNQRLLRLTTPLGEDVLLAERLSLHEDIGPWATAKIGSGVNAGLTAYVHVLAADAHIELKTLLGQPVVLQLEQASGSLRPWHGHITAAELQGSDGGLARYLLTIEPWLAFLAHRQDSWVFQGQTVMQIIEEVFADYSAGKLAPVWRWELADADAYPKRSLCIQYQETDLAFVQRLLREEGLFYWWEHAADLGSDSLGAHTLVIADHNAAFKPGSQPLVRYTQAGLALKQDSITRWRNTATVQTAQVGLASQDYRSNAAGAPALRVQLHTGQNLPAGLEQLAISDVPGLYAYEDSAQGERLALRQIQALDALRSQTRASGTLRQAAPGSTFTLVDHPVHSGALQARDEFVVLGVEHQARNNLSADHKAQVLSLLGAIRSDQTPAGLNGAPRALANDSEAPVYSSVLRLQPAATPVRLAAALSAAAAGQPDVRLHARPTVHGVQTALVVSAAGQPVHTDRDHRIKVQFHWQRGANASHRINHLAGDNAPASEASGTWVRVSQAWAGANWGANFIPRVGQEVLVGFIGGDIDRPVVMGSVYNGQGQANAQSNQTSAGAACAVGDAPAWFPGTAASGKHQGHQHGMVLAGHKSQELATSAQGSGGYNQLVFDDSPGQGRIELASSSAQSRLQLGHLLHQADNQRLHPRGHGADLASAAWGAVRAGSGLLISAHGKPGGSLSGSMQIDTREAQSQLNQARELIHTLAESAQKHNAKLAKEPDVVGATQKQTAKQLPVEQGLNAGLASLVAIDKRGEPPVSDAGGFGGASEEASATEETSEFDEQLIFVNANGAVLSGVGYEVLLADGSRVSGTTDDQGRTSRIVTGSSQAVTEVTLQPKALKSCCAAYAHQSAQAAAALTFKPDSVATNAVDVGSSSQQVPTPKGKARGLTAGEIDIARQLFKDSIDYGKVKVHNGEYLWFGLQQNDTAMTPNGEMYFNPSRFKEDFSASDETEQTWFMHEMGHVWQYQLGYGVKLHGLFSFLASYTYHLDDTQKVSDFKMEAQAELLADYWANKYQQPPTPSQRKHLGDIRLYETVLANFLVNPADEGNLPRGGK